MARAAGPQPSGGRGEATVILRTLLTLSSKGQLVIPALALDAMDPALFAKP